MFSCPKNQGATILCTIMRKTSPLPPSWHPLNSRVNPDNQMTIVWRHQITLTSVRLAKTQAQQRNNSHPLSGLSLSSITVLFRSGNVSISLTPIWLYKIHPAGEVKAITTRLVYSSSVSAVILVSAKASPLPLLQITCGLLLIECVQCQWSDLRLFGIWYMVQ